MAYKTILVHADLSRHAPQRIATAITLAKAHGATLLGVAATNVSALVYPAHAADVPGGVLDAYFGSLRDRMSKALDQFETQARAAAISFQREALIDYTADGMAKMARFADLLVLSQDDPAESLAGADFRVPEQVILRAPCPVLVMPAAVPSATTSPCATDGQTEQFQRVLVAWNGSIQAAAAVHGALPLLRRAAQVEILSFAEDSNGRAAAAAAQSGGHDEIAGHELAALNAYLGRHQIAAQVRHCAESVDKGYALLDAAASSHSDLIVMGCYGHARWRELCLGGVSRTLLSASPVALLMAHR